MTGRGRLNLALLVIVAGLAALVAIAPDGDEPMQLEKLSAANPLDVSRIRLHPEAGDAIELLRSSDEWRLVEPIRAAANAFRVSTLLGVLAAPVHTRIDAPAESLSRYGLEPPRARLELDEMEILFGDTESIHGRRYLLYDGRVALVDDAYFSHLASSAANYVDPLLLGPEAHPRRIELPGRVVYLDGDVWRQEATEAGIGDDEINRLVEAWRGAQATAVRPFERSLEWSESIRIELPEGDLEFELARTEYEVILGRRSLGFQYHLTKAAGSRLLGVEPAKGGDS